MAARHPRRSRSRHWRIPLALGAVSALALTGCSSSSAGGGDGQTLTIQSGILGFTALENAYAEIAEAFAEENPDVTVEFSQITWDELVTTGRLQLTGSNPPMLTQANQGYEGLGAYAAAGLLVPLDDDAAEYGWSDEVSESFIAQNGRFSADGAQMADGELWGMSVANSLLTMWMNVDVAAELGIDAAPQTLSEMEEMMAAAADAGIVPLQFGTADGQQGAWLVTQLMAAFGGPEAVESVVYHQDGATIDTEHTREAAQTIAEWAESGYFTPDWTAYTSDDVFSRFLDGEGLFTLSGTWQLPNDADDGRFEVVPLPSADGELTTPILTGDLPWVIPANAENHELAAEFIDFMLSEQAQEIMLENGNIPVRDVDTAPEIIAADPQFGPAMQTGIGVAFDALGAGVGLPYLDWAGTGFLETIQSGVDELTAGRVSADEFVTQLQAGYEESIAASEG